MEIWYQNCTVNVVSKLLMRSCFKERSDMAIAKAFRVTINFYKTSACQLSHGIKNIHRSKLYQ